MKPRAATPDQHRPLISAWIRRGMFVGTVFCSASAAMAQQPQQVAEVVAETASVMDGKTPLGVFRRGEKLRVVEAKSPWVLVAVTVDGKERRGWIQSAQVRLIAADALATPVAVAAQPQVLRIKSDRASLMVGSQAIATVRRGELREVRETKGPWYAVSAIRGGRRDVGWVADKDAEILPFAQVGPSLTGDVPDSISAAESSTDWKSDTVTLVLSPPVDEGNETAFVIPEGMGPAGSVPVPQRDGDRLTLTLAGSQLLDLLTPGTRSAWLSERTASRDRMHRIDLPPPTVASEMTTYRYPNFPEGIVVHVPVTGLTPGFVLEYAKGEAAKAGLFWPMTRVKGTLPRLADVYQDDRGDQLRIIVPGRADGGGDAPLTLRVRSADGSLSNAITVHRNKDTVEKTAVAFAAAQPALIDSTAEVPSLELVAASSAIAQLAELGLTAQLVDDVTLAAVSAASAAEWLIQRQGIRPGERLLMGDVLLLTVSADDGWRSDGLATPDTQDDGAVNSPAPVDVADDLGFIDLAGGWPAVNALADARAVDDSNLADVPGGDIDSDAETLDATPVAMAIAADPGVNLDPQRDLRRQTRAAILRLTLQSIFAQGDWRELPSLVGRSITVAIRDHEQPLKSALAAPPVEATLDPVVNAVIGELQANLSAGQRAELRTAAFDFARRRWNQTLLDRNGNGAIADDLAVFVIVWLFDANAYDPATHITVVASADGSALVVAPLSIQSPNWIDASPPPITLTGPSAPPLAAGVVASGGSAAITTGGSAAVAASGASAGGAAIPPAEPVTTRRAGPDQVRVPEVIDEIIEIVVARTNALGLSIAGADQLLNSDKVVSSTPGEQSWTPSSTALSLSVVRRVPNLLKLSRQQAEKELTDRKFSLRAPSDSQPGDIVVTQNPLAGDLAPGDAPVDVTVQVMVPDVVGKIHSDATATLKTRNLSWRSTTKAFTIDKVVAQTPAPGALIDRHQSLDLTVHVPVPNLVGMALGAARTKLHEFDLREEVSSPRAREQDVVRGQRPQGGVYVPHDSTATLGPVLGRVPRVIGRRIREASAILTGDEDYPIETVGPFLDDDLVTRQNPQPGGEYERGRTVTLDARVTVPNVRGQSFPRAEQLIQSVGGSLSTVVNGFVGRNNVVYSQQPSPGELVFPRTDIRLTPGVQVPDVRERTSGQAFDILDAAGLNYEIVSSSTRETTNRALFRRVVVEGQRPNPGLHRTSDVNRVELRVVEFVPALRTVPNVVARELNIQQAIAEIKQAELVPIIVYDGQEYSEAKFAIFAIARAAEGERVNPYTSGVGQQDPEGGSQVLVGSRVRITAALFK